MGEVINELFEMLSKDLHFNATKLNSETYEQNWKVPEGLISIIGLENAKMPVFYYGITNSYEKEFEIKKIITPKGQKQIFARIYYIFDYLSSKDFIIFEDKLSFKIRYKEELISIEKAYKRATQL